MKYLKYFETFNNDILNQMKEFGLDETDIDNNGYVTLYHGGKILPKTLNKGEVFYMTPDINLAKDYAILRKGKVFKIKVKPEDVSWHTGSEEVHFDNGGTIKNNILYPNLDIIDSDWDNYGMRSIDSYRGVSKGDILPKTKRVIQDIIQYKDGSVQLIIDNNYIHADSTIDYEYK